MSNTSTPTLKYSIDRKKDNNNRTNRKNSKNKKRIVEKIPDVVSDMLVTEVLSLVGDSDWNDPSQVSATLAKIMSIDTSQPLDEWEKQVPVAFDVDRTVLLPSRSNPTFPFWIFQSLIRVDDRKNNRYIEYEGSKYNKVDIVFGSKYFKKRMNTVASYAGCTWNARWGNSRNEDNKLYQKTRPGEESWLDKCIKPLLTDGDDDGINIKDLVMIEFKRKLPKKKPQPKKAKVEEAKQEAVTEAKQEAVTEEVVTEETVETLARGVARGVERGVTTLGEDVKETVA